MQEIQCSNEIRALCVTNASQDFQTRSFSHVWWMTNKKYVFLHWAIFTLHLYEILTTIAYDSRNFLATFRKTTFETFEKQTDNLQYQKTTSNKNECYIFLFSWNPFLKRIVVLGRTVSAGLRPLIRFEVQSNPGALFWQTLGVGNRIYIFWKKNVENQEEISTGAR